MIKLDQTRSNVNVLVLDEAKLEQVVGGHGRCGGYRKYHHRYENRRHYDCYNYEGGYESKGSDDSSENYENYEEKYDNYDNYDHCGRKYS